MPLALVVPIAPASQPSLRAKALPRSLNPLRAKARETGSRALDMACQTHGVGSERLAECLGLSGSRGGSEARSGALVVTAGEVAMLAPLAVAIEALVDLLRERVARERIASDTVELRMAGVHLDALHTLLAHR